MYKLSHFQYGIRFIAILVIGYSYLDKRENLKMKCPNCQTELTGEEKFCIKCGTKISVDNQPKAEVKTETEVKPEEKEAPKAETAPQGKPEEKAEEKTANAPAQPAIVTPKPMSAEAPKEPVKIEPVKPDLKPEPDIKDPESMIVKAEVSAPPVFCIKCGAKMQPSAKFCTKCGTPVDRNQKPAGTSSVVASTAPVAPEAPVQSAPQAPVQSAPVQAAPVQTAPAEKPAGKKTSKGLIILIILAICAIIVAILLALKTAGVFANIGSGDSQNTEEEASDNSGSDEDEENDEDEEEEEDPEATEARRQEINDIMDQIDAAVAEGDQSDILNGSYETALDGFITLASKYELADDVSKEASEVFAKYAQQTRNSIALLDGQKVSSGLYIQSRIYYDDILSYVNAMSNAGIKFDDCGIQAESDALIETYRAKYIFAINEITSLESWSRDEAWALMEDAASVVDDDGNRVLFNDDDPDDPMRLRYIYSLAWKTRKDIETGIANGDMTYEDALDKIDEVLRDTDYNLMLLHDGIYYCDKAGIDSAPYKVAFDNEIEKIQEFDKIIIVLDPDKTDETHILMNRYWAFNDISGGAESAYQVSYTNGTSSTTRAWIRENIRVNR